MMAARYISDPPPGGKKPLSKGQACTGLALWPGRAKRWALGPALGMAEGSRDRQLPYLGLLINLVTGRHLITPCVPPSHVIGRDKASWHLPQMNSHPAQNPGLEEKARQSREENQGGFGGKLSKYWVCPQAKLATANSQSGHKKSSWRALSPRPLRTWL